MDKYLRDYKEFRGLTYELKLRRKKLYKELYYGSCPCTAYDAARIGSYEAARRLINSSKKLWLHAKFAAEHGVGGSSWLMNIIKKALLDELARIGLLECIYANGNCANCPWHREETADELRTKTYHIAASFLAMKY